MLGRQDGPSRTHCETNSRPRSKTLHVGLSIPTVKFMGTLRQGKASGGDK